MTAPTQIRVVFADKYRLWQELVHASDREGRVFVATDVREAPGSLVELEVFVQDEQPLKVRATVESRRPPSLRFSRGLFLRLPGEEVERLRSTLGLLPSQLQPAAGRMSRRYNVRWPVVFRTPALLKPVVTEDISADGIHVEMPERVRRGHVLELTLHTPQGHELGLAATVMWTSETHNRVGLQFYFEDEDTRRVFRGMLEHAVLSEAAGEDEGATGLPPSGGAPAVLIADDDPSTLDLLTAVLESRGYRVVRARSGEEALSLVRSERPDLVVLDILTPALDGLSVCRAMRADAELAEVPVLFLSTLEEEDLRRRAEEAGASDYLHKPIDVTRLLMLTRSYAKKNAP